MSGAPDLPKGLWTETRDPGATRGLYDDWAARYDSDMEAAGVIGPSRLVDMLIALDAPRDAPVLDFGCGTGLCGVALAEAGFTDIVGQDISEGMIARARGKGVYRDLTVVDPDAPVRIPEDVRVVTACGAICVGAAPAPVLGRVARAMEPDGLLMVTLNDDTIRDPDHVGELAKLQIDGVLRIERSEYGPQLPALGRGATVAALRIL
jgi:predicted TPR repeat methyltransferase